MRKLVQLILFCLFYNCLLQAETLQPEIVSSSNHKGIYYDYKKLYENSHKVLTLKSVEGSFRLIGLSGGFSETSDCNKIYSQAFEKAGLKNRSNKPISINFSELMRKGISSSDLNYSTSIPTVTAYNFPELHQTSDQLGPYSPYLNSDGELQFSLPQYYFLKSGRTNYFNGQPVYIESENLEAALSFKCKIIASSHKEIICKAFLQLLKPEWNVYPQPLAECSSESNVLPIYFWYLKN